MSNSELPPVRLHPEVEAQLRSMSEQDFDLLCARVRLPDEEPADPKLRAAKALAKAVGGGPKPKVTKEAAANALATYRENNR